MRYQFASAALVLNILLAVSGASPASAEATGRAQENARRSLATALGERTVPILSRQSVRTPESALSILTESLKKVDQSFSVDRASRERQRGRLLVSTNDWRLTIFGDGSAAEFVNLTATSKAHENRLEPGRKMSTETLQAMGRDFIARYLADTIVLGPAERLEAELVSARMEGGVAADGTSSYSAVVANRIVFTREIDGIPVVGAGSKVTITFLNDGGVESFRYDWPQYVATSRMQATVDASEILNRVSRTIGLRAQTLQREGEQSTLSPEQSRRGKTTLQRLACGYYDAGIMARDPDAPVQTGCYYHLVETRGEGEFVTKAARSGAVPAGQRVEIDPRWPEVARMLGVDGSAAPDATERPVPPRERQ
ncbi:hypothetical protein [Bradyrhizobium symbiodeficiens]|uniref:hypothetical protein n=1 Tax=Bradyrhizobium symbiodeficiens TaxID=1404367 RepID=UPI000BA19A59|nr:hypothetical protein [Bradyrhizobium symbiodeficiens]AWM10777.1 hypothetical protein CIT39_32910 [Bradyrhizobium symbiodeficiens]